MKKSEKWGLFKRLSLSWKIVTEKVIHENFEPIIYHPQFDLTRFTKTFMGEHINNKISNLEEDNKRLLETNVRLIQKIESPKRITKQHKKLLKIVEESNMVLSKKSILKKSKGK